MINHQKFFGLYCCLLLVHSCVYAIYDPNDGNTKKGYLRTPEISEPIVMHHKYSQVASNRPLDRAATQSTYDSTRTGRTSYTNDAENYVAQYGLECPPNATGQFPYLLNCRQFLNCWKGRGHIQSCAPGTVFNPDTLECDNPAKVICLNYRGESNTNNQFARLEQETRENVEDSPSHIYDESSTGYGDTENVKCPPGVAGLHPHPFDCAKFLSCSNGITHVQDCGPGTVFNPTMLVCDWPYKVDCSNRNSRKLNTSETATVNQDEQYYTRTKPRVYHTINRHRNNDASIATSETDRISQSGLSPGYGENTQATSGSFRVNPQDRSDDNGPQIGWSANLNHQHNHHRHHQPGTHHHHHEQTPPPQPGWRRWTSANGNNRGSSQGSWQQTTDIQGEQESMNRGTQHHQYDSSFENSNENATQESAHRAGLHYHHHRHRFHHNHKSHGPNFNHTHHRHHHYPHHRHQWHHLNRTSGHSRDFHLKHPNIPNPFPTNDLGENDSPSGGEGTVAPRTEGTLYPALDADKPLCQFDCQNGKCVSEYQVCDGVNNCGNRLDETNCNHIGFEVRLSSEEGKANMGRVEVKVRGQWGYVCDDKFGMRAADVLCKELGFVLGASEVRGNSYYPPHKQMYDRSRVRYLMDEVDCLGNETSIKECKFMGWGVHDCSPDEVVGVVCKVPVMTCPPNYWLCKTTQECVAIGFLCDSVPDCQDSSDESEEMCNEAIQFRIIGGPSEMEGRVEVKYRDTWGTICDDDFGKKEAQVICRTLGYLGEASILKNAHAGGTGPIWLDQVSCIGNETTLEQCTHWAWGEHNCDHKEDVSVRCSERLAHPRAEPTTSTGKPEPEQMPEEDIDLYLYKVQRSSKAMNTNKRCGQINEHAIDEFDANDELARVVNGTKAIRGHHPWQASLRAKGRNGMSSHWCGAILITQMHVLTAAHCLIGYQKEALFIRMGDHYSKIAEPSEIDSFIQNWYIHEEFRKGHHMNNDIGLIVLKSPVMFNDYIQPICLPPKDAKYEEGMKCTISGWGSIKSGISNPAPSNNLKAAHVPIIPQAVCKEPYVYGKAITDGMFCAGYLDEGVDACDGDSGGPLACSSPNGETLYGIISWGQHCGQANKPGVYVKVSYYLDWIMEKIMYSMKAKHD